MAQNVIIDCYEVLGVARDATTKEINYAYKKLALKHHPDKEEGSNDVFQKVSPASPSSHINRYMSFHPLTPLQIQHAVEILRDTDSRSKHDEELESHAYKYEQGQSDTFEFPPGYTGWRPYNTPMGEPVYMSRYMYSYGNSMHMDPHSQTSFEERLWWENMRAYEDDLLPPEPSPMQEQCELDEEVIDANLQHDEHVWMAAEKGTGQWGQWRSEFAQSASNQKGKQRVEEEELNDHEKSYGEGYYRCHYKDRGEPAGDNGEDSEGHGYENNYQHGDGRIDKDFDEHIDEHGDGHGDGYFVEHFDDLGEYHDGQLDEEYDEHGYEPFDGYCDERYKEDSDEDYNKDYDKDHDGCCYEHGDKYHNEDYEPETEKTNQHQGCGQTEGVHESTEEEVDLMEFSDYETADQSPVVSHSGFDSNSNVEDPDALVDGNTESKQSTTSTDNGTDVTTAYYDAKSNQSHLTSPGKKMSIIGSPVISGTISTSSPRKTDNLSTITSLGISDQESTTSSDVKSELSHSSQKNTTTFSPMNRHLAPFITYLESKILHPSQRYTTEDLETEIKGIVLESYCGWLESVRLSFSDANPIPKGSNPETCAHLGAWEKEFKRPECEVCHRWRPIFMLTCPGCGIRKCVGCKFDDWGKSPRERVHVDTGALPLGKDGMPGVSQWPAAAIEVSGLWPWM